MPREPLSPLSQRLINDGLKPTAAPAPDIELRKVFHSIAMDVLSTAAPGLTDTTRNSIAILFAARAVRAAQRQEKAA